MQVRIYKPCKTAMQSGRKKSDVWLLEPELTSPRLPEQLMGWTSSQDTLNQVKLSFDSLQAATQYAQEKGYVFTVIPDQNRIVKPRNYVDNFKYSPAEDA
jgi:hypothetical protein